MVAGVKVTVHDEQGKLLEVGDASQTAEGLVGIRPAGSKARSRPPPGTSRATRSTIELEE